MNETTIDARVRARPAAEGIEDASTWARPKGKLARDTWLLLRRSIREGLRNPAFAFLFPTLFPLFIIVLVIVATAALAAFASVRRLVVPEQYGNLPFSLLAAAFGVVEQAHADAPILPTTVFEERVAARDIPCDIAPATHERSGDRTKTGESRGTR